jgi:hypothetical protein
MTTQITRVTMIKIPSEEHIAIALKGFETFAKNQNKVDDDSSIIALDYAANI